MNILKLRKPVLCAMMFSMISGVSIMPSFSAYAGDLGHSVISVTNQAMIDSQREDFNKSMTRIGFDSGLTSCQMMIKILPDRGQDESFGAICKLGGNGRNVMVCDDTMIGKFTFKAWGFSANLNGVAYFTRTNCPPGG